MEFTEIKELLALFDQSSVREFNLQGESFQLYLNKNEVSQQSAAPVAAAPVGSAEALVSARPEPGSVAPVEAPTAPETRGKTVDSPIVGVAYLSSGPEEPAFKQVGDTVAIGETLCIVEAMKIMNEITSDVAGTINEILIENEQVVEYGQPLFRIV